VNWRRLPILILFVAALSALVAVGREAVTPTPPVFSTISAPWMPAVPVPGGLTSSWFCPGVPASGEEGTGGEVVIANAGGSALDARVTLLAGPGEAVEQAVTVPPHRRTVVDVDAALTADFVSAMVEIDGGGGLVEQTAVHPEGTSVAACANAPAPSWYFAEGFTAEGSLEQLVLTNPYDESAIVDIGFATEEGSREPAELQGYPVPARSVKVIDLATIAARDEPEVAVKVVASRGNLVVGRAQVYEGGARRGFGITLASPALRDQWWFANGEKGPGVRERYSIYNPTEDDVEVAVVPLGIPLTDELVTIEPIPVAAHQVVTFSPDDVADLPAGRHAMVFSTGNQQSIVVEQAFTRTIDDRPTTAVLLGAPPRLADGYVAATWSIAIGPDEPTTSALIVYNVDNADATVTVQTVTPEGIENVPSLAAIRLPASGLITVDLTERAVLDRQLIVRSTSRVFVARLLPREPGAQGRTSSWAVPASS
jgi:Family of unknown function (DUF5719)